MPIDPELTAQWTAVDGYLTDTLVADDPALTAALAANAAAGLPPIDVAPNQGKFLHLLAASANARRILEIGTLGGYSTIWLARALPADGRLITLELDPHHAEVARANIARAGSPRTSRSTPRPRVLSGMRPTGSLHLGNYMGALYNWVHLQQDYDCYFFIADLHALTTDYADPGKLQANIQEIALDFLAAGLDPGRCVIFKQSDVPAARQLFTALQHVHAPRLAGARAHLQGPAGAAPRKGPRHLRLPRLPAPAGRGHPALQAGLRPRRRRPGRPRRAHPRGRPPLQLSSTPASSSPRPKPRPGRCRHPRKGPQAGRRAQNNPHRLQRAPALRGRAADQKALALRRREILPEPQVLLTPSPKLPGLDGRKMSKSYKNTIMLSEPEADHRAKLKTMVTDPARIRRDDPGNPDVCPVFDLHKVFSSEETAAQRPPKAAAPPASAASSARAGSPTPSSNASPPSRPAAATSSPPQRRQRRARQRQRPRHQTRQQTLDEVQHAMGSPNMSEDKISTRNLDLKFAVILRTEEPRDEPKDPEEASATALPNPQTKQSPSPSSTPTPPRHPNPSPPQKRATRARTKPRSRPSASPSARSTTAPSTCCSTSSASRTSTSTTSPSRASPRSSSSTRTTSSRPTSTPPASSSTSPRCSSTSSQDAAAARPARRPGESDAEDPRRELVERLLEHERFKAAAQMLQQKQMLEEATWTQPGLKSFLTTKASTPPTPSARSTPTPSTSSASFRTSSPACATAPSTTSTRKPSPSRR
jgi:tryptophanyl-tRNA synthetase